MRVVLVISSMGPGGAERVMKILADGLSEKEHDVSLVTILGEEKEDFYHANVSRRCALGLGGESGSAARAVINNLRIVRAIRQRIRQIHPEVVVSFLTETNVLTYLATRFLDVRLIVAEHTDPEQHCLNRPWELLRKYVYRRCDYVVAPTRFIKDRLDRMLAINARVIPNPVEMPSPKIDKNEEESNPVVLAIGRMSGEKNHVMLLDAFEIASRQHECWKLKLVGDGPDRQKTIQHADDIGIGEKVEFPGLVREPWRKCGHRARIFVLSSVYEGFPMALCEAMAAGLAVISTRYNKGVEEIIEHGKNGLLVPSGDVAAMADAIRCLMDNPQLRDSLGREATGIATRFGTGTVVENWVTLAREPVTPIYS